MDNKNFLTFVVLSACILMGFHFFYEKPRIEQLERQVALQKVQEETKLAEEKHPLVDTVLLPRVEALALSPRVKIDTAELKGSINLKGAKLDDLVLVKYRETIDPNSPEIVLLSPMGTESPYAPYYASFGWRGAPGIAVPNDETVWKADDKLLSIGKPLRLSWDNGQGLLFERTISIDESFLFTITDRVKNTGAETVTLSPSGAISRHGLPQASDRYLHTGFIGALGGTLKEIMYEELVKEPTIAADSTGGWLGITDKYWLVSLIPQQDEKIAAKFTFEKDPKAQEEGRGLYQTDFRGTSVSLAAGASSERTTRLFAGAKRVALLDQYEKQLSLPLFDRAIDFGWYYYLTKPFLYLLDGMNSWFGNMGIAIVLFTIILKLITLPLSVKSYRSMAKLRALQPQLQKLQDRYKDDRQKLSMEMMELYKREKVSPMSGCVPIFIQIPIFFALYKVLYVGIEMRHAPLFGWVKDMSMPDPTSVLTLFGTLDWSLIPDIGVWPILMGASMFIQQKMSPQPTDKSQAQIFMWLPLIFTFMMREVAVGLIFYWTVSNIIGIGQQWYVTRKVMGHK